MRLAMLAYVSFFFVMCAVSLQPTHLPDREPYLTKPDLKSEDSCFKYLPIIFILSDDYSFYTDGDNNEADIPYGTSVKLWCQCLGVYAAGLLMKKHGEILSTKAEDETSITWSTGKLELQKRTEYTCAVKETVCESSLFISVVPAVDVILPNGQFSDNTHTNYSLEYGNSLTILCSGPTVSELILTKDEKQLPTEHVNSSTINWFKRRPDLQISTYVCTDVDTGYNRSVLIKVLPVIFGAGIVSNFDLHDRRIYNYVLTYEDTFAVFCSGPRAVKFITLKNYRIVTYTENLNETTAKLSITSSDLRKSVFACVDSEFPDYMSTMHVTILPRIVLTSPNIIRVNGRYVAKNGDPLEIVCSGPDAAKLTMRHYDENIKRTEALLRMNATSIKWFINKFELRADHHIGGYVCSAGEVISAVDVEVLPHPEAVDFHCVSYNLQYLNCTWSTLSNRNNFTLLYIKNGLPVRIYEVSQTWFFSPMHRFCVWYSTDYPGYPSDEAVLSFIMQSCNSLGCFNQTFYIDHLSIVKLNSPVRLGLYRASSRHVQLSWDATDIKRAGEYLDSKNGDFNYRVEYWYPGIEPLEANSSLVACYPVSCLIELTLPCSGQWYEVRVYQKLKRTVEEEFWSNPTSINFYVEAEKVKMDVFDPTCNKGPRKTKDVMIYLVQKLREEVNLDKLKISKEVDSLKKKLNKIRTYLRDKKDRL